ncbi:MAG: DoxX family protein [Bacteroidetes bacterium]|nr:DoxX family protein [Bacteroidota bacterium]
MKNLRQTLPNKFVGVIRIFLGVIFMMTGAMKLTLADYGAAWSIQLIEAEIPFYAFNYWFVPVFEVILGIVLFLGYYSRIGALMVLPIMLVAIYVHLTVSNPGAFPSQPQEPYMPIAIIILAFFVMKKGGGNWSMDMKSQL